MLPGQRDILVLVMHLAVAAILILFTILSGYDFINSLKVAAGQTGVYRYVWNNAWATISGPGATFFAFLFSMIANIFAIFNHYRSNLREMELRQAFSAGIWTGYRRNFLDRILRSFAEAKEAQPVIILIRPTYGFMKGDFNAWNVLKGSFFAELERRMIATKTISGDAFPFREAFQIAWSDKGGAKTSTAILDLPTTFMSFEGAVEEISEKRDRVVSPERARRYFDDFTEAFFDKFHKWGEFNGCKHIVVKIDNADPVKFADLLSDSLKALT